METLDYVEAYLAKRAYGSFAANFDFDGMHFIVDNDPLNPNLPRLTIVISPDDDTDLTPLRDLAFNMLQQLYSETTNNDVCATSVYETYDLAESRLTYVSTIVDYMT